jgi:hypothetical protein
VILEDNESNIHKPEAAAGAVSVSVDAGADSTFELSKPIDPSGPERWFDVEASCYVNEELLPDLGPEQGGLAASTPVHDHGHSCYHPPRSPHDQIGQYNDDDDENTQHTSEEPALYSLPKWVDEDGDWSEESVSELERDMLLAFEEQRHDDDREERGKQGEKRPRQDRTGEVSSDIYSQR